MGNPAAAAENPPFKGLGSLESGPQSSHFKNTTEPTIITAYICIYLGKSYIEIRLHSDNPLVPVIPVSRSYNLPRLDSPGAALVHRGPNKLRRNGGWNTPYPVNNDELNLTEAF